ncbi:MULTISPECIES: electron transport complex subunit E [unclassified Pseudodesulfovibrio]|uniref:electron transport complex subunit RsxE n=1 Tax=unclassified Pseudodesulfovibrio TaxID=2661612 RepID=UPI000FEBA3DA|nr:MULTISPECIES: electron transport complex subunit E [unclassified Pseudodesulfovibrio]MCJ2164756.1 electron transport complex subunit E [Pseudodesulfovibrio sp. S3-i]RWU04057.1 electron transport complex subunit E [Pseudodesulfovibrio sp. S3]
MHRLWKEFSKGLWKDLPPFKLVLGLCPVLAVTNTANNGLGMGMAVIFVLTLSNLVVSLLRKLIPPKVRIACFIAVSASLVVAVELLMQAYAYPLYQQLGIFVPLIVVNCIILGRAEAFASKNGPLMSMADGMGMGIGFTMSLTFLGGLREALGTGTLFGANIAWNGFEPLGLMGEAPGAFISLGILLALMTFAQNIQRKRQGLAAAQAPTHDCGSCGGCGQASNCS